MLLMQAGRRLRTRHPDDQVDPSCFPLAKVLLHHPDGMRVSDLATRLQLDASTVSRQIKQLQDKGLLERTPDPADGRASLVQLSEHGRDVMHAGFQRRLERIQSVLDTWDEGDREQLRLLLARLATDLSAATDRGVRRVRPPHPPKKAPHDGPDPNPRRRRVSDSQADPGGDGRPDGRHVPRRPRPVHRRHRAPPHHQRARRPEQAELGRHGLPADPDRLDAVVGQDLRPLRPQADLPGRDRDLPDRLPAVRARAEHRAADRLPRRPGPRRRRPVRAGARHHGRHRAAA